MKIAYGYRDANVQNYPRIDFQYVDRMIKLGEDAHKFAKMVEKMTPKKTPPARYGSEL